MSIPNPDVAREAAKQKIIDALKDKTHAAGWLSFLQLDPAKGEQVTESYGKYTVTDERHSFDDHRVVARMERDIRNVELQVGKRFMGLLLFSKSDDEIKWTPYSIEFSLRKHDEDAWVEKIT
jgi:hypothetical protein